MLERIRERMFSIYPACTLSTPHLRTQDVIDARLSLRVKLQEFYFS